MINIVHKSVLLDFKSLHLIFTTLFKNSQQLVLSQNSDFYNRWFFERLTYGKFVLLLRKTSIDLKIFEKCKLDFEDSNYQTNNLNFDSYCSLGRKSSHHYENYENKI